MKESVPGTPAEITLRLKERAKQLGFGLVGSCPARTPAGFEYLKQWIASGYSGQMRYLQTRLDAYAHPRSILPGARSLLMLGCHYGGAGPTSLGVGQGRIARYAAGAADYHDVLHPRLRQLGDLLKQLAPAAKVRGVVDTAPLLEREFGQQAGLGWIGKNTMLINRHSGSWFFLAALITDQWLAYDVPETVNRCGTCRACLDACPTRALVAPGVLDARRCLSYRTIELRGSLPPAWRREMRDWLFGCDVCQEVCPWNRRGGGVEATDFQGMPESRAVELAPLFSLTDEAFRRSFHRTALWRTKRRGLLRNAALLLGNQGSSEAVEALLQGLRDPEPLVRAASVWGLGRLGDPRIRPALRARLALEDDPEVRQELRHALDSATDAV